jgi:hypothetical protein
MNRRCLFPGKRRNASSTLAALAGVATSGFIAESVLYDELSAGCKRGRRGKSEKT